jgi:hypothetical protein
VAKPTSKKRGRGNRCLVGAKRRRKRHEVKVRKQKSKDMVAISDLLLKHLNTMFATYA